MTYCKPQSAAMLMLVRAIGGIALLASPAAALQTGSTSDALDVEMHGFVSPGFMLTTGNNYLAESEHGSFEFAEVGINFTKSLTERLRVGIQLFARDLGPSGDYDMKADWFYLDYRFSDRLGLRAGRIKIPFGLYNEVNDVDAARVPILLPQSTYPITNRDFLLAQTGTELYGYVSLASAGAIDYRLYGGTIFLRSESTPGSPFEIRRLTTPYLAGGRVMWEPPLSGLRVGGSMQALRLESTLLYTAGPTPVEVEIPAVLWVVSSEYIRGDWLLAAEYGRWHVDIESDNPALFPESSAVSERGYAMVTYHLSERIQPGLYYSLLFPDTSDREGREDVQHDGALTLRFDVNPNWLIKVEGHYMDGTAALNPALNGGVPRASLVRQWWAMLVKTTVYF